MSSHTTPRPHILGNVCERVEDGIHGVDMGELHQLPVGQLAALVELPAAVARLKDVESGDLGAWEEGIEDCRTDKIQTIL